MRSLKNVFQVKCSEFGSVSDFIEVVFGVVVVVDAYRSVGLNEEGFLNEIWRFAMGARREGLIEEVSCALRGVGELV